MQYLATTNPGLEDVAAGEVRELLGVDAERLYRGTIGFEADERATYELNYRSRTLHRVGVVLVDRAFEGLDDLEDLDRVGAAVRALPIAEYVDADRTFGIRPTRHGDHEFTSMDLGDVTGQAVIDAYREATGERLAVDLDDPDVILRAFVRDDHFYFALDTTGEESLHHRHYRVCEHNSPLRPTIGAAMLRLAGYEAGDRLLDPMCGSGTILTEAALSATGDPPGAHRESFAVRRLATFDPERFRRVRSAASERRRERPAPADLAGSIRGTDVRERWIRCARENLAAAGVDEAVGLEHGDATERPVDADLVVSNLPFGIRTPVDLRELYAGFSERLRAGDWNRAVLLTTRPEFLDLTPTAVIDVRYGRLDASVVVLEG